MCYYRLITDHDNFKDYIELQETTCGNRTGPRLRQFILAILQPYVITIRNLQLYLPTTCNSYKFIDVEG